MSPVSAPPFKFTSAVYYKSIKMSRYSHCKYAGVQTSRACESVISRKFLAAAQPPVQEFLSTTLSRILWYLINHIFKYISGAKDPRAGCFPQVHRIRFLWARVCTHGQTHALTHTHIHTRIVGASSKRKINVEERECDRFANRWI